MNTTEKAMTTDRTRILVVDNEIPLTDFVQRGLSCEGYSVGVVHSAKSGWNSIIANRPDLVILDVVLPDMDGMTLCQNLRQKGQQVPILMLTARNAVADRVAGLDAGADAYLSKPCNFEELLARVRALLRRHNNQEERKGLTFADLTLHLEQRKARRGKRSVRLTTKEHDLLAFFLRHPCQVLTRTSIIENVWGYDAEFESNVLEVYVHQLRHKLGLPSRIETVRGVGYILR